MIFYLLALFPNGRKVGQTKVRTQELPLGFPCGCRGLSPWAVFCGFHGTLEES